MPEGGQLTIDVEALDRNDVLDIPELRDMKAARFIAISVTDAGIGIPAGDLEHIFEPFFTTKKPEAGTGLGLFTVAGIVRGHGGHIRVRSHPGQGSTFSVFLPAIERRTDSEVRRLIRADFHGNGERVLYVDDEPAVCDTARLILRRLHFEPITAPDGLAGLDRIIEFGDTLCAVITDVNMPNMDGLSFARALRQLLPVVPLIVASGRPDAVSTQEMSELGIHVMLEKPFTQDRLAVALQRALNAARGTRSATSQ
jgi:two-component system, cell cycle sensor histidine kinase and response regulator CckA